MHYLFYILMLLVAGILVAFVVSIMRQRSYRIALQNKKKPLVMIVIDSLMDQSLQTAIQRNRAPALAFLQKKGTYIPQLVSCFPTMSVCIDTTLLTGTLPREHKIYGLCYYHQQQRRLINLGTGAVESIYFGLRRVLTDSLLNLNQKLISKKVTTIHEAVDVPTASINAFIYRGKQEHQLKVPRLITFFTGISRYIRTRGPSLFSFGSLLKIDAHSRYDQPWLRYGENDRFSTDELLALCEQNQLPPFTIVYFPSNDDHVHQKGVEVTKGIEKADRELQRIFNSFASWDKAVEQVTWAILGDSGQTNTLSNHKEAFLDMKEILPFRIMTTKQVQPQKEDQIVLSVNERMCYLNLLDSELTYEQVIYPLHKKPYFDIIAWWEGETCHVVSSLASGQLSFSVDGPYQDHYGQSWNIVGEYKLLDLKVANKSVQYGDYPDVLNRLMGVYEKDSRKIVVTCVPGYEMVFESSPKHKGASHGSMHYMDSCVPLIIAGTKNKPQYERIVDLKHWILKEMKHPVIR